MAQSPVKLEQLDQTGFSSSGEDRVTIKKSAAHSNSTGPVVHLRRADFEGVLVKSPGIQ
jgi:hypothetical protein